MRSRIQAPSARTRACCLPLRGPARRSFPPAGGVRPRSSGRSAELLTLLHQPGEPQRVIQRQRRALAGVGTGGVRGRRRSAARGPRHQVGNVATSRVDRDDDVLRGIQDLQDRSCQRHEISSMLFDLLLAHRAVRRASMPCEGCVDHHITRQPDRAAKAVTEEPALAERGLGRAGDRRVRSHRTGTKPPKPIRPVVERGRPSGTTCARSAECTPSAPMMKSPSAVVRRQNAPPPAGRRGLR